MTDEVRDKFYNQTMSEVVYLIPGELPIDAVGLWQIVPKGRDGFSLSGSALADFVGRCIHALLEAGAVPVRGGKGTGYEWIMQSQYGATKDQIVENVVREWQQMTDDPLVLCGEGVWFALPDPAYPKYVKLD